MENIHSETYSLLIEQYIKEPAEKEELFDAIHTMPAVRDKARWAVQWMNREASRSAPSSMPRCLGWLRLGTCVSEALRSVWWPSQPWRASCLAAPSAPSSG